jgi:hypothetical protein
MAIEDWVAARDALMRDCYITTASKKAMPVFMACAHRPIGIRVWLR